MSTSISYQLTNTGGFIIRSSDGARIPTCDPSNADYQKYLAWAAVSGNVALAATGP